MGRRQTDIEREMEERGDDGKKKQLCWEAGGEQANNMAAGARCRPEENRRITPGEVRAMAGNAGDHAG